MNPKNKQFICVKTEESADLRCLKKFRGDRSCNLTNPNDLSLFAVHAEDGLSISIVCECRFSCVWQAVIELSPSGAGGAGVGAGPASVVSAGPSVLSRARSFSQDHTATSGRLFKPADQVNLIFLETETRSFIFATWKLSSSLFDTQCRSVGSHWNVHSTI